MSTQIAVRLPDELVAYVDRAVAEGRVRSRAELVTRLIERDATPIAE
jgi:Arc/MetJ-type ribon-helix-helix transcriptional regulator